MRFLGASLLSFQLTYLRLILLAFQHRVAAAKCRGCLLVAQFEELYKVRDIGECTLGSNLRHGAGSRGKKYLRTIQSLDRKSVV